MRITEFINRYNLRPADAIAVKKDVIGLLDHYLLYLGKDYWGEHLFMANYSKGTRILTREELSRFASYMHPVRIARFMGNNHQRQEAVDRAFELKDQNSYHLILNNCEHFKSYVQEGKAYSNQTKAFGAGLAAAGLVTTASSKSNEGKVAGIVMAGLGLLTVFLDDIDD